MAWQYLCWVCFSFRSLALYSPPLRSLSSFPRQGLGESSNSPLKSPWLHVSSLTTLSWKPLCSSLCFPCQTGLGAGASMGLHHACGVNPCHQPLHQHPLRSLHPLRSPHPLSLQKLQDMDERRATHLGAGYGLLSEAELQVVPIIAKCLEGMKVAAEAVDAKKVGGRLKEGLEGPRGLGIRSCP